jgi:membrane-associated phospholipid phosphatase
MPTFLDGPTLTLHRFAVSNQWLTGPVIVITAACILLCPVALLLTWRKQRATRPIVASFVGLVIADLVCRGIGGMQFRARPFVAYNFTPLFPHSANTSFPSSTTAFAATVALVMLLAWRRLGRIVCCGALFVGFGCVYVGVHYVGDVVVGYLIGAGCGAFAWYILGLGPAQAALEKLDCQLSQPR